MPKIHFKQKVRQLEKRKGGYYFLEIDKESVDQFEKKRATRLVCTIHDELSYSCGLNHLGDGNFFIILSNKNLKKLGLELGDYISFYIEEDPNPLGVAIPEVLEVLLVQDPDAKKIFEAITDGKKRSLIYSIARVKDIDKQVHNIMDFLKAEEMKLRDKNLI
ncbi:MAG: DUF1905 domain-containing protein [Bacteroidota bacterium]